MIRLAAFTLLALAIGFDCWVAYRLETKRLQDERAAFEARKAAAREHLRADALRRHEEMMRVFERGKEFVQAAKRQGAIDAAKQRNAAHRGSQR